MSFIQPYLNDVRTPKNIKIKNLSCEELYALLKCFEMKTIFIEKLKEEQIDGPMLIKLTENKEILIQLGLTFEVQRDKLRQIIIHYE